ncbi:Glutaminase kidney isoform, mitochondrial [Dirofilaria immitis]|nr:Glutaminase kidney isoform, mitochondrial [Dirofilaria immitis]
MGCIRERQFSTDSVSSRGAPHIDDAVFDLYKNPESETLSSSGLLKLLYETGIRRDDPRLANFLHAIRHDERKQSVSDIASTEVVNENLDRETFKGLFYFTNFKIRYVGDAIGIIAKALKKQLVIPDWPTFISIVATYIPQLARSDPKTWAMSVCTIDGQRRSWGATQVPFCLQSVSKPFTYAIAMDELGAEEVHRYVGQEPSGRLFNEICLDHNHKPHNPMINAGAILVASLLKQSTSLADRFDFALQYFKRFAAGGFVGFNNAVFLSERETADRNYALSYYMREHKCFHQKLDTLDLYFQLCAIETNVDTLAVMAATLANGGVSPLSEERVVCNRAVRDTLSLMYSCGMYDYSGQFAFKVGLPAKSGVSGDMIIVVPNVMGICLFSPPLDQLGNTVRGVKFAEQFVEKFNFHNYDSLKKIREVKHESVSNMMYAATTGDISSIQRYLLLGASIAERDYDDRTVLHVAAAHGNENVLKFLLQRWLESPDPLDRYGRTPLDDAKEFGHFTCVEILERALEKFKIKTEENNNSTTNKP